MLSPVHREECQDILESGEGEEHGGHGGAGNCELHGSPGLTLYSNGGDGKGEERGRAPYRTPHLHLGSS